MRQWLGKRLWFEGLQAFQIVIVAWPVILGRGKHYWGSMLKQQTLKLLSVKKLKHGELMLHYETVR